MMKLCKDCKHNRRALLLGQEFARCAAIINPATSKPAWFCDTARSARSADMCGLGGNLWEQRVSLWSRIKAMVKA